jgi:hypothetical protein
MPLTGNKYPFGHALPSGHRQQLFAQGVEPRSPVLADKVTPLSGICTGAASDLFHTSITGTFFDIFCVMALRMPASAAIYSGSYNVSDRAGTTMASALAMASQVTLNADFFDLIITVAQARRVDHM